MEKRIDKLTVFTKVDRVSVQGGVLVIEGTDYWEKLNRVEIPAEGRQLVQQVECDPDELPER